MKEVREYAQSHVDVEDFKDITGIMEQKGRSTKKAKKVVIKNKDGTKLKNGLKMDWVNSA